MQPLSTAPQGVPCLLYMAGVKLPVTGTVTGDNTLQLPTGRRMRNVVGWAEIPQ